MTEIEVFFRDKIEPHLGPLNAQRKEIKKWYFLLGFAFVAAVLSVVFWIKTEATVIAVPVIGILAFSIYKGVRVYNLQKVYRIAFKGHVVAQIVKAVNPSWTYNPERAISPEIYRYSDMFRTDVDRYRGDDLVAGVIDKTDFECSELHTEYKQVSTDSKGRRHERWVTVFKGLFFHADFNKAFKGRTYVSPDMAENIFGKFGQTLQRFSGPAPLVKLENVEFEKAFVVHATDQIEARYILTPTIMEAMLRIKQLRNCDVHFSFVGSRVFCALSISGDLFEPKIFREVSNLGEVQDMYSLFKLNEVIVGELNLNTRIWTKD
jgi:hypothetical protein